MHITIVGAGIVGCATAFELASRGADVTIIDTRSAGGGATQASAGILAPRIEGHSDALLGLGLSSLRMYDRFIERIAEKAGAHLEYARTGTLQVATTDGDADALSGLAKELGTAGVEHALMSGAEAQRQSAHVSEKAIAALLIPEHGYVAVRMLTDALVRASTACGATWVSGHVGSIHANSRGAQIVSTGGTFSSDAVIMATGSWPAGSPRGGPRVKPVRGQLLQLRAPDPLGGRVIWGSRCYIVPWRDGSALVGATVEDAGFDERATAEGVHQLLDAAMELVPSLAAAAFVEARVGLRPMLTDELPAIGASRHAQNVYYAVGHYRNGVLLAPLTAVLLADLVLDGREGAELALTRPDRFGE